MSIRFRRGLWSGLVLLAACGSRPPFVVLTIEDPNDTAASFASLHVGTSDDNLTSVFVKQKTLPLTITVTSKKTGDKTLLAELRDATGTALARGMTSARFADRGTPTAAITLARACAENLDCDDGLFCTGEETCTAEGLCAPGTPACVAPFACVTMTCNEEAHSCEAVVAHAVCESGTACTTNYGCIPCSPALCQSAEWCNIDTGDALYGECLPCGTPTHCGPTCVACPETTPLCAGTAEGCVCNTSPSPRGSCPPGSFCDGTACSPCNTRAHCGQNCLPCSGNTPICGGPVAGCITDDCSDKPDMTRCQTVTDPDREYDICAEGVCVSPGCGLTACSPPAPSFARYDADPSWRYHDTSQRTCIDPEGNIAECPGTAGSESCASTPCCGQDAQYGADVVGTDATRFLRYEPVFGYPVVTDNATGLMWQGCLAGMTGADCDQGGGYLRRAPTAAVAHCESSTYAGYRDWRLADVYELVSVADYDTRAPAFDHEIFPNLDRLAVNLWTSTLHFESGDFWWALTTHEGSVGSVSSSYSYAFLCVRSGHAVVAPVVIDRFVSELTGTGALIINDQKTGLSWQGCAAGMSGESCTGTAAAYDWPGALAYCEDLELQDHIDWRLPNKAELLSLVNHRRVNPEPAIDPIFLATPTDTSFWTSTLYASDPPYAWSSAWAIMFFNGSSSSRSRDTSGPYVRCVRDILGI